MPFGKLTPFKIVDKSCEAIGTGFPQRYQLFNEGLVLIFEIDCPAKVLQDYYTSYP